MLFVLKKTKKISDDVQDVSHYVEPLYDGKQIHFVYNGKQIILNPMETIKFDLALQIQQMPQNSALQIHPHDDQIKGGTHGAMSLFTKKMDIGKLLISSLTHFDKKSKKISKGDRIFKGILKAVFDGAQHVII